MRINPLYHMIEIVRAPHSLTVSWPDSATLAHGLVTFLIMTGVVLVGRTIHNTTAEPGL